MFILSLKMKIFRIEKQILTLKFEKNFYEEAVHIEALIKTVVKYIENSFCTKCVYFFQFWDYQWILPPKKKNVETPM